MPYSVFPCARVKGSFLHSAGAHKSTIKISNALSPLHPAQTPAAPQRSAQTTAQSAHRATSLHPTAIEPAAESNTSPPQSTRPEKSPPEQTHEARSTPAPSPRRRIASNSTSSPNTNEKSRSTAGYFPSGVNRTVRNPIACSRSRSISARKTSCRNFRSAFTLFRNLPKLRHRRPIHQHPRRSSRDENTPPSPGRSSTHDTQTPPADSPHRP